MLGKRHWVFNDKCKPIRLAAWRNYAEKISWEIGKKIGFLLNGDDKPHALWYRPLYLSSLRMKNEYVG